MHPLHLDIEEEIRRDVYPFPLPDDGGKLFLFLLLDGVEPGDGGVVHVVFKPLEQIQIQQEIPAAQPVLDQLGQFRIAQA